MNKGRTGEVQDPTQFERVDGGWRVRETDTHFIDIYPMLFNDRIVTVPKAAPLTVDRYWCYDKGGPAFLAAAAWDGSDETEPVGWKKAHGNRYPQQGQWS